MANKTNPIGVRFNKDLLDKVSVSPQKALNLYEQNYLSDKGKEPENVPENKEENGTDERDLVLQQIADIKKQTIPKERDTFNGKKIWEIEQRKRIDYLLNKIIP